MCQLQNFSKYVLTIAVGKSGLDRLEKSLSKLRREYDWFPELTGRQRSSLLLLASEPRNL